MKKFWFQMVRNPITLYHPPSTQKDSVDISAYVRTSVVKDHPDMSHWEISGSLAYWTLADLENLSCPRNVCESSQKQLISAARGKDISTSFLELLTIYSTQPWIRGRKHISSFQSKSNFQHITCIINQAQSIKSICMAHFSNKVI